MGFFDRLFGGADAGGGRRGPVSRGADLSEDLSSDEFDVSHALPDAQWRDESRAKGQELLRRINGSPEQFAEAAKVCYDHQRFGVAVVVYCKAVDLLHTQYGYLEMRERQPGPADAWIVDGFISAVGASLSMHPDANFDDEVREGTHRLRSIASTCERVGLPATLYQSALKQLRVNAPNVPVDDILWT